MNHSELAASKSNVTIFWLHYFPSHISESYVTLTNALSFKAEISVMLTNISKWITQTIGFSLLLFLLFPVLLMILFTFTQKYLVISFPYSFLLNIHIYNMFSAIAPLIISGTEKCI